MTYGVQLEPAAQPDDAQSCEQYPSAHPPAPAPRHSPPWHWLWAVHGPPVGCSVWFWQVPEVHVPELQVLPLQHGWPTVPHATQTFDWHTLLPVHAGPVVQQAWPTAPQAVAWQ
jgi:hypothetical protein